MSSLNHELAKQMIIIESKNEDFNNAFKKFTLTEEYSRIEMKPLLNLGNIMNLYINESKKCLLALNNKDLLHFSSKKNGDIIDSLKKVRTDLKYLKDELSSKEYFDKHQYRDIVMTHRKLVDFNVQYSFIARQIQARNSQYNTYSDMYTLYLETVRIFNKIVKRQMDTYIETVKCIPYTELVSAFCGLISKSFIVLKNYLDNNASDSRVKNDAYHCVSILEPLYKQSEDLSGDFLFIGYEDIPVFSRIYEGFAKLVRDNGSFLSCLDISFDVTYTCGGLSVIIDLFRRQALIFPIQKYNNIEIVDTLKLLENSLASFTDARVDRTFDNLSSDASEIMCFNWSQSLRIIIDPFKVLFESYKEHLLATADPKIVYGSYEKILLPAITNVCNVLRRLFEPSSISTVENYFSTFLWRAFHYNGFYNKDGRLRDMLGQAYNELSKCEKFSNINQFASQILIYRDSLLPILRKLDNVTVRTGFEDVSWKECIEDILFKINDLWTPSKTKPLLEVFDKSSASLLNAISIYGDRPSILPYDDPLEERMQSPYEPYLTRASYVYGSRRFWKTCEEAEEVSLSVEPLRKLLDQMNGYAKLVSEHVNNNTIKSSVTNQKELVCESLLYGYSIGILCAYENYPTFVQNGVEFIDVESRDRECIVLYNLFCHVMSIIENVDRREINNRIEIQKFLHQNYSLISNKDSSIYLINLLFLAFYTKRYTHFLNFENKKPFEDLEHEIIRRIFGQKSLETLNVSKCYSILERDLPNYLRSTNFTEKEQEKLIFHMEPLRVVTVCENEQNPNSNPHLYTFSKWALYSVGLSGGCFELDIIPSPSYTEENIVVENEFYIKENHESHPSFVSSTIITETMLIISEVRMNNIKIDMNMLGTVAFPSPTKLPYISDKTLNVNSLRHISLKIESVLIEDRIIDHFYAMFYVYDEHIKQVITEPVIFQVANGIANLTNGCKDAVFVIPQKEEYIMVCRLLANGAMDIDSFLTGVSKNQTLSGSEQRIYNFAVVSFSINQPEVRIPTSFYRLDSKICSDDADNEMLFVPSPGGKPQNSISVQMKSEIKFLRSVKGKYSWATDVSGDSKTSLIVSTIHSSINCSIPLITLSDISFQFKNVQKCDFVYFKAKLFNDDNDIKATNGLKNCISFDSNEMCSVYSSTILSPMKHVFFPDIVRFYVGEQLGKKAHIIIEFWKGQSGKNADELYKISIIHLFQEQTWLKSTTIDASLFGYKDVKRTSGYLHDKPRNAKSRTRFRISIPELYFPHYSLFDIFTSNDSLNISQISSDILAPEHIISHFVPIFAKLVYFATPKSIQTIVAMFPLEKLNMIFESLHDWCLNNYAPYRESSDHTKNLLESISEFLQKAVNDYEMRVNNETILNLIRCSVASQAFLMVLQSSIVWTKKMKPKLLEDRNFLCNIKNISQCITKLLLNIHSLEIANGLNMSFSEFTFVVSPLIKDYDISLACFNYHIETLLSALNDPNHIPSFDFNILFPRYDSKRKKFPRPISSISRETLTEACSNVDCSPTDRIVELTLDFLEMFGRSPYIFSIATRHNSSFYDLYLGFVEYVYDFYCDEDDMLSQNLLTRAILMYSQACIICENFSIVSSHVACNFVPDIHLLSIIFDNKIIYSDYTLVQHLSIPLLFFLGRSEPNIVASWFQNLDVEVQNLTLVLLRKFANSTISIPNESEKFINLKFYQELTKRVCMFLDIIINSDMKIWPIADNFSSLLSELLSEYQVSTAIRDIVHIYAKFVSYVSNNFFTSRSEAFRVSVAKCVDMVCRKRIHTRSLATALILHMFYYEFVTHSKIINTSNYLFDVFIEKAFSMPDRIAVLKTFASKLNVFLDYFLIKDLQKAGRERMSALLTTIDCIRNALSPYKSRQYVIEQMYIAAEQVYNYPALRLKWLKKIANYCDIKELYPSRFVAYTHISALIYNIMSKTDQSHLFHINDDLKFGYCPSADNRDVSSDTFSGLSYSEFDLSLDEVGDRLKFLLIDDRDFSLDGMINSLEEAKYSCKEARMAWHFRYPAKYLASLQEYTHRYDDLILTTKAIADNYYSFDKTCKIPLYYYLLIEDKVSYVYISLIKDIEDFAVYINEVQYRDPKAPKVELASSVHDADKYKACVISVEAMNGKSSDYNTEFYAYTAKSETNYVKYTYFVDSPLPSISGRSLVVKVNSNNCSYEDIVIEKMTYLRDSISHISRTISALIPLKERLSGRPLELMSNTVKEIDDKLVSKIKPLYGNSEKFRKETKSLLQAALDSVDIYEEAVRSFNVDDGESKLESHRKYVDDIVSELGISSLTSSGFDSTSGSILCDKYKDIEDY